MDKNNKNNEIEKLERKISREIEVYRGFKNSDKNDRYFNNISKIALSQIDEKNKTIFWLNPSFVYTFIFIISFVASYQLVNFSENFSFYNSSPFFSETSIWLDEEEYLSSVLNEEIELDYANYIKNEIDYSSSRFINYDINQLSDSELDEVYENIKNKKIF